MLPLNHAAPTIYTSAIIDDVYFLSFCRRVRETFLHPHHKKHDELYSAVLISFFRCLPISNLEMHA